MIVNASDRGLHCLLTVFSIPNIIKMEKHTRHPVNGTWTLPVDKDGKVHMTKRSYIDKVFEL